MGRSRVADACRVEDSTIDGILLHEKNSINTVDASLKGHIGLRTQHKISLSRRNLHNPTK